MAVLDIHTHLFPPDVILSRQKLTDKEKAFTILYSNPKSRMVDLPRLQKYLDEECIDKAVVLSFPFEDNGLMAHCNDYIIQASKVDERIVPFVMINRRNGNAATAEGQRCFDKGACGIGELAFYDTGFTDDDGRNLEEVSYFLEEKQASLVLHVNEPIGHDYAGKSPTDFGAIVRFVLRHPKLKIVLAHLGGGICFYEFMPEIRRAFENVYYDCAAAPFIYSQDVFAYATRFLGPKILFGSDYPLLPLKRYKPLLMDLTEEEKEQILYRNGVAFLNLKNT
jgi:uncharacterized protein